MFELTNEQRTYFGLDPVQENWERYMLPGDQYRADSILFFDGETIKKKLVSTKEEYFEIAYNVNTQDKTIILPKTKRGKPKKLTPSVLESQTPIGVYCYITNTGLIRIGSHATQKTFYDTFWEDSSHQHKGDISKWVDEFIKTSPQTHFEEITQFRNEKKKHVRYKVGDFFRFKINRSEFAFGRVLFNIKKMIKKKLLLPNHGLTMLMGPALLVKVYNRISKEKELSLVDLKNTPSLPSDYMMDNHLYYGEYEVIGNLELEPQEFDFPISYGRCIHSEKRSTVFLQWGLIHLEKSLNEFSDYLSVEDESASGIANECPYRYSTISFSPHYGKQTLNQMRKYGIQSPFNLNSHFIYKFDLRNPANSKIRNEILEKFGLDPNRNYHENAKSVGVDRIVEFIQDNDLS